MAIKILKRAKRMTGFTYSVQAQLLINRIKNFDIEKFEADYANEIIIGDKVIAQYIVEKEVKIENEKRKLEKSNGS